MTRARFLIICVLLFVPGMTWVADLALRAQEGGAGPVRDAQAGGQRVPVIKMPKDASWARQDFLPGNIERMCYFFRNGWQ